MDRYVYDGRRRPQEAITVLAMATGLFPLSAGAEPTARDPMSEPLVTDRPDFTESTEAVPTGHFQLELGYTFTYDREGHERTRSHTAPELLVRVGVFENFEVRIGWEGYTYTEESFRIKQDNGRSLRVHDWSQGANDLTFGVKYKIAEQSGWRPHFGLIAEISAPSGSPGISAGDVEPGLVALWAYDVSEGTAVAGNVGFFGPPDDDRDRFFQTTASISVAHALTDRLGVYAEYFGLYPNERDSDCAHFVNGGFTFLVHNNLQFDWRIGAGLNEEADDFFTGVGLAWRF